MQSATHVSNLVLDKKQLCIHSKNIHVSHIRTYFFPHAALPQPTAPLVPCKDRSVVLRCQVSGQVDYEKYIWRDSRGDVVDSDLYNVKGRELTIADVCAVRGMLYHCGGVLSSGTVVMGESYRVEPLGEQFLFVSERNFLSFFVVDSQHHMNR